MAKRSVRGNDAHVKGKERKVPSRFTFSSTGKAKGEHSHLTKSKKKKLK